MQLLQVLQIIMNKELVGSRVSTYFLKITKVEYFFFIENCYASVVKDITLWVSFW